MLFRSQRRAADPPRHAGQVEKDRYEEYCDHCSQMEQIAANAERASVKYKQVEFMSDKIGRVYDGVISGVTEWGLYVELNENKCEGLVPIRDLDDDFYTFDEENYALVGRRRKRTYRLGDPLTVKIAQANPNLVVAQLLFLDAEDSDKDINLYINSPGGSVTAGMAIYDTVNYIRADVSTICVGMAASMGAFLLSSGTKGKRFALPNAEVMIHQPLGGAQGQASDVMIHADWIMKTKEKMNRILSENTGKDISLIEQDTDRDKFMSADEAKEYGLIDEIIQRQEVR